MRDGRRNGGCDLHAQQVLYPEGCDTLHCKAGHIWGIGQSNGIVMVDVNNLRRDPHGKPQSDNYNNEENVKG